MFVMIRHAVIKEEAMATVKEGYDTDIKGPVVASPGNRFFCVLNSVDMERKVRQMTGWDSKEDCDRYMKETYPAIREKWGWVFDEKPVSSFWEIKWPGKIQFDPTRPLGSGLYIRTSRFKFKPEGMAAVIKGYDEDVIAPVVNSKGNRFIFVLLSTEEERVGSQVTAWDSKEDCDRYLNGAYLKAVSKVEWVFEEKPVATFWEIKWPGLIQF